MMGNFLLSMFYDFFNEEILIKDRWPWKMLNFDIMIESFKTLIKDVESRSTDLMSLTLFVTELKIYIYYQIGHIEKGKVKNLGCLEAIWGSYGVEYPPVQWWGGLVRNLPSYIQFYHLTYRHQSSKLGHQSYSCRIVSEQEK